MNKSSFTIVVFESFPLLFVGFSLIFNGAAIFIKVAINNFNEKKQQEADHER